MLKITNLNKYYRRKKNTKLHVINNTTLEIPESGIIAVVGRSGVGKTTLLNAISGLDKFKSGQFDYDGKILNKYKFNEFDALRMANYGFIFQNYYLSKDKTVYENIIQTLALFDLSESEKKERINYVLKQLGIAKYTNKLVKNLSGGEQQRVSIARALVKSPKIIFADEPTGSLDEKTTFTVLNILKKISKNCAVFIVTHEKQLISYYADYMIELDEGTVINRYQPEHGENSYLAVDQNIYLNELSNNISYSESQIKFDIYRDESDVGNVDFTVAIKNNKIYLKSNQKINLIDENSEAQMIDGSRFEVKDYVIDSFDYNLDNITYNPKKLKYRNAIKNGFNSSFIKSGYKIVLKLLLIIISALTILLVNSIETYNNIDLALVLTRSKGRLDFELDAADYDINSEAIKVYRQEIVQGLIEADLGGNINFDTYETLNFEYSGFYQYEKKTFSNSSFDFRSKQFISEKDLIYGRMPESRNEIVIDTYFIERFLYNSLLNNVISNYNYFIGKTFVGEKTKTEYKIVGISNTKNPTIYGDDILAIDMLSGYRISAIYYDEFIQLYPEYAEYKLEEGQCFKGSYSVKTGFEAVVDLPSSMPYKIVINRGEIDVLKYNASYYYKTISIETDGTPEMIENYTAKLRELASKYYREADGQRYNLIKVNLYNRYETNFNAATKSAKNLIRVLAIISAVFGVVALIFITLSTVDLINSQIVEIAIMRSLGYPRKYVFLEYFTQIFTNSIISVLIGSIATYGVMNILSLISFFNVSFELNIVHLLLTLLGLSVISLFIGALPLIRLLKKTPTEIYNSYNI